MRSRLLVLIAITMVFATVTGSLAYWTTSGGGAASASVGSLNPPPQPVLTNTKGSATVEVNWTPGSKLSDNVTSAQGYYVTRYNGSTTSPACGTSPASLTTSTTCTDTSVPSGTYTYQAVAVWHSFSATSVASKSVVVVITPPTGTISYTNGYNTTGTVAVTFSAIDEGSGVNTASGQLKRAAATLSNGSCGEFGSFEKVGPEGVSSPYSDSSVPTNHCYKYEYIVSDNFGNPGTITSASIVKVDTTAPTNSLSLTSKSGGGSFLSGSTLYYQGSILGSFKIQNAVADSGSGPASSAFPTLGGTTTGWTHTGSTVNTPAGGPYVSNEFKWTAGTSSSPTETITGADAAGNTTVAPALTFTRDISVPTGSITYTNGYNKTGTVEVTFSASDVGSGVNTASGQLKRASTTLTSGVCGSFGGFENVGPEGVSSPYNDSSVATSKCYEYEYVVSDNVGNQATITSASIVKVDTVAPTNSLSLTSKSGGGSFLSGTTLYYQGSVLGSFKIQNAVADTGSGPASSAFPALGGTTTGWTHTATTPSTPAGGPYVSEVFSWTASTSSAPTETVTGADAAGNTTVAPALTLTNDTTAPTGSITYTNGYNKTGTVEVTFSASDTGSGVNTAAGRIKRAEATYTELTDTCGSFGAFANVGVEGQTSPFSNTGLSSGKCYKYEYVVSDNVGNPATITSESIVKVDTTAPEVKEITSKDPGGAAATGKIQNGSTLIITFKSRIEPASIAAGCPASCTITGAKETRTNNENVLLVIPGITTAAGSSTGSSAYLSGTTTATATFTATVAFSENNTVLTVTVSELAGATPTASEGKLNFTPASTITDPAGNAATGSKETAKIKLF
jgi:hypothetical protein